MKTHSNDGKDLPASDQPVLVTDRLLLRRLRPADQVELARTFSDPEVMRYVGDGRPLIANQILAMIERITRRAFKSVLPVSRASSQGRCDVVASAIVSPRRAWPPASPTLAHGREGSDHGGSGRGHHR
jgi:hypothetical protein